MFSTFTAISQAVYWDLLVVLHWVKGILPDPQQYGVGNQQLAVTDVIHAELAIGNLQTESKQIKVRFCQLIPCVLSHCMGRKHISASAWLCLSRRGKSGWSRCLLPYASSPAWFWNEVRGSCDGFGWDVLICPNSAFQSSCQQSYN